MQVVVELFGIPRARAGVARTTAEGEDLGDILEQLVKRYPALAAECVQGRRLQPGYTANLGGEQFVTDPATKLREGEAVLILSVDAGG